MKIKCALVIIVGLLVGCQTESVRPTAESSTQTNPSPTSSSHLPVIEEPSVENADAPAAQASTHKASPSWRSIGLSVQKRPILIKEMGQGKLHVLIVGGIHGNETEGRSILETLKEQKPSTIRIIQDINPDGTHAHGRTNSQGVDLNRNWPARNFKSSPSFGSAPLSEPETRLLNEQIKSFKPSIVIVLHSTSQGPFVNFDGPANKLAEAFVKAAQISNSSWRVQRQMGYDTPGSMGSYLGVDQKIQVLTIEFKRGQDEASAKASFEKGLEAVIITASSAK